MRKTNKVVALLLTLVFLLGAIIPVGAAVMPAEVTKATIGLVSYGIVDTPSTTADNLTRGQFAKVAAMAKGTTLADYAVAQTQASKFKDIKTKDWYNGWSQLAPFQGVDAVPNFAPKAPIKTIEVLRIMVRLMDIEDAAVNAEFMEQARKLGLTDATDAEANTAITRGEAFVIVAKALDMKLGAQYFPGKEPILTEAATGMTAAKAVANNKVQISFATAPTAAVAASSFTITDAAGKALEVKGAMLVDGKVYVETAAMTAGTLYTIKSGTETLTFTGISKDTSAPTIVAVKGEDVGLVSVEFSDKMDAATATNVANYSINNGVVVKSATLSDDAKTVTLSLDNLKSNKGYIITISDVTNSDMVKLVKVSRSFVAIEDKSVPTLVTVVGQNNKRVKLTFSEGLDKTSAMDMANYSIKDSAGAEVAITEIIVSESTVDSGYDEVVLVTEEMVSSKSYKVTVSNVKDDSVTGNMIKTITRSFATPAADKNAPVVTGISAQNGMYIELTVTENNALAADIATDPANYTIVTADANKSVLNIQEVTIKDNDNYGGTKTIVLKTDAQESGKNYTVTVMGLADEYGNAMKSKQTLTVSGSKETVPGINGIQVKNLTTLVVSFTEKTGDSAKNIANYFIDGVGNAISAKYVKSAGSYDKTRVELTFPTMVQGKTYTLEAKNIEDSYGLMGDSSRKFVANASAIDLVAPKVISAYAENANIVSITFDKAMQVKGTGSATLHLSTGTAILTAVGTMNNGTTVLFKHTDANLGANGKYFDNVTISALAANLASDPGNVAVDSTEKFSIYSSNVPNLAPKYSAVGDIVQLAIDQIQVSFTETVVPPASGSFFAGATVKSIENADGSNDLGASYIVTFTAPVAKELPIQRAALNAFTDVAGLPASAMETVTTNDFKTWMTDADKPYVVSVNAVDSARIEVVYNEAIKASNLGSYEVKNDTDNTIVTITGTYIKPGFSNTVVLMTNVSDTAKVYKLTLKASGAQDLSGNVAETGDVYYIVGTTANPVDAYISGVNVINKNQIKVGVVGVNGAKVTAAGTFTLNYMNTAGNFVPYTVANAVAVVGSSYDVTLNLSAPLAAATTYQVVWSGATAPYEFYIDSFDGASAAEMMQGVSVSGNTVTVGTPQTFSVVGTVGGANFMATGAAGTATLMQKSNVAIGGATTGSITISGNGYADVTTTTSITVDAVATVATGTTTANATSAAATVTLTTASVSLVFSGGVFNPALPTVTVDNATGTGITYSSITAQNIAITTAAGFAATVTFTLSGTAELTAAASTTVVVPVTVTFADGVVRTVSVTVTITRP